VLLHALLDVADVLELRGDSHVDVESIAHDSRRTMPGALFCCIRGATTDGHEHAGDAVARGAVALLVDRPLAVHAAAQARVACVRRALGPIAARFHGDPSRSMRVLGVTGTNGKTTTTYLLESVAVAAGERAGVIGTTGARVAGSREDLGFTTPEAPELQAVLARMRDRDVGTVAMEVSSHALAYARVDGTRFAATCFTNLSPEHLDQHGTLEDYFAAKARLFTREFTHVAAIAVDDPWGAKLAARAGADDVRLVTFGLDVTADVHATGLQLDAHGSTMRLATPEGDAEVRLPLAGRFNAQNALAAAATALAAGFALDAVVAGLQAPVVVPGRMEPVAAGQPFTVVVDYAHTPDALERLAAEARRLAGAGRVLLVFGCGGERDPAKRPAMGRAAGAADLAVLTSDNPRSEDPAAIAAAAADGLRAVDATFVVELDRRAAIRHALQAARAGDVVVIAGKGHETGQESMGVVTPFDDRVVAREELEGQAWT
jgi:UDP-N-acetylmuramoyl-L-alanyl-D-glutamate--2,6-diaminopimelate ligase